VVDYENIDLLILGTHGRGGLNKLVFGSVSEQLSRLVPCPVLTIGRHVPPITEPNLTFAHILLATDFGRGAELPLRYAFNMAKNHNAQLTVMHTIPPRPPVENIPIAFCPAYYAAEEIIKWQAEKRKESIELMESLVPSDSALTVAPQRVVAKGFLPDSILDVAHERKADLIVMGAHNSDTVRMAAHDPGTVLHSVVAQARCPVLTVMLGTLCPDA
jgi:nucleotide-binding universal stress UspA family protein